MPWLRRVRNNTPCLPVCGAVSRDPRVPTAVILDAVHVLSSSIMSRRRSFALPHYPLLGRYAEFGPVVPFSSSPSSPGLPRLYQAVTYFWFIIPSIKASRSKLGDVRSWLAVTGFSQLRYRK